MSEDIPYKLKCFLQDIGVRDVFIPKPVQEAVEVDVWLPKTKDEEPPF